MNTQSAFDLGGAYDSSPADRKLRSVQRWSAVMDRKTENYNMRLNVMKSNLAKDF